MYLAALCLAALFIGNGLDGATGIGEYSRTVSYEDEMVLRCPDKTKQTVQIIQKYGDVWQIGLRSIDLRLKWSVFAEVEHYFPECWVVIGNVEEHVQRAEAVMFPARKDEEDVWVQEVMKEIQPEKPGVDLAVCEEAMEEAEAQFQASTAWFKEYHDYEAICQWYEQLASCHPDLVTYVPSIGQTVEGRNMPAVHITATGNKTDTLKIYFQCIIHAREWIAGATCMYIASHLVNNYGTSAEVSTLLDSLEFIIVPIVNPDGYAYTWSGDRLWRKNKAPGMSEDMPDECMGVDLNRNFPQGWKQSGNAKYQACSEDYGGPSLQSEPETNNIINYFKSHAPIIGAIDWHSHGQLILRPWGWSMEKTEDDARLKQLGTEMSWEIYQVSQQSYISETSKDLYQCYGIASDWFYSDDAAETNQGYRSAAYVVELRDKLDGKYAFLLPPEQIIPTGDEIIPAALHFASSLLEDPIPYQQDKNYQKRDLDTNPT